jgi:hypothetical protein
MKGTRELDVRDGSETSGHTIMKSVNRYWIAAALLFLGVVTARAQDPALDRQDNPPPLERPVTELAPLPPVANPPAATGARASEPREMLHEALQSARERPEAARVHVRREPPASIVERPSGRRPGARAQWVPGYWEWDAERNEFVWMGGMWQVAPPGSVWAPGRWVREADGWYRAPGSWVSRRDGTVARARAASGDQPAWRTTGPPATHPDDTPDLAPGPDYFFVSGHYVPEGDRLAWRRGFWARLQPGWDWVPARWVRRSEGWEFRRGYWARDPDALAHNGEMRRQTNARPVPDGPPPAAVDFEAPPQSAVPEFDRPPPPALEPEGDPIAEAERRPRRRVIVPDDPDFFGPITGMPFYMIRPPGAFPYGPGGVVVPGAVPPFVRRILDRVLP